MSLVSTEDQNLILPGVSETDINTRKSFAVRLIGRAMFCWFLKQKKSDNGQLVPDEILSSKVVSDNYYHNVLEPLFFGVLNTSIDARDIRTELFDKVPYLNGGSV
jgi:adenine-specific DNA-methyltransferase